MTYTHAKGLGEYVRYISDNGGSFPTTRRKNDFIKNGH